MHIVAARWKPNECEAPLDVAGGFITPGVAGSQVHGGTCHRTPVQTQDLAGDPALELAGGIEDEIAANEPVRADFHPCGNQLARLRMGSGDRCRPCHHSFEEVVPIDVRRLVQRGTLHPHYGTCHRSHAAREITGVDVAFDSAEFADQSHRDVVMAIRLERQDQPRPFEPGEAVEGIQLEDARGNQAEIESAVSRSPLDPHHRTLVVHGYPGPGHRRLVARRNNDSRERRTCRARGSPQNHQVAFDHRGGVRQLQCREHVIAETVASQGCNRPDSKLADFERPVGPHGRSPSIAQCHGLHGNRRALWNRAVLVADGASEGGPADHENVHRLGLTEETGSAAGLPQQTGFWIPAADQEAAPTHIAHVVDAIAAFRIGSHPRRDVRSALP